MKMEGDIPGHPGYTIEIGDEVKCYKGVKEVTKKLPVRTNNTIYWTVDQTTYCAERLIQDTFPGLCPGNYIYQLYKDIPNTVNKSVHRVKINENVLLELLYNATSYCLTIPLDMDIKREIRNMFPGPYIEVEKGDINAKRKEVYFTSKNHLKIVQLDVKKLFSKY